jgi:hypothetical protein
LGPPHEPGEESIQAFKEVQHELKKALVHLRREHRRVYIPIEPLSGTNDKPDFPEHEPEYFAAVVRLSRKPSASFFFADAIRNIWMTTIL